MTPARSRRTGWLSPRDGPAGVATTAKHFPGLGRVRGNTDFTSNVVDTVTTADDPYLQSYEAAIRAGAPFVMVSLATYTRLDPTHLAVFSARVMQRSCGSSCASAASSSRTTWARPRR